MLCFSIVRETAPAEKQCTIEANREDALTLFHGIAEAGLDCSALLEATTATQQSLS